MLAVVTELARVQPRVVRSALQQAHGRHSTARPCRCERIGAMCDEAQQQPQHQLEEAEERQQQQQQQQQQSAE